MSVFQDNFQSTSEHCWLVSEFSVNCGNVSSGILDKLSSFVGSFHEDTFEVVSCPLDGVLDLIREVLQSAKRDRFLRRVNRVAV